MLLNAFSLAVSSQWAELSSWLCGRYQTSVLGEVPHGQEIMFGQVCLLSHVLTEALPCHHFFYCLSGLLSSCSDYLSLFGATIPTFCRWVAPVWKPKVHAARAHWVHIWTAQSFGVNSFQHTRIPHIHLVILVYILCLNDLKCVLAASFEALWGSKSLVYLLEGSNGVKGSTQSTPAALACLSLWAETMRWKSQDKDPWASHRLVIDCR